MVKYGPFRGSGAPEPEGRIFGGAQRREMDQYDYLSRDQLLALLRALGAGGARAGPGEPGQHGSREPQAETVALRGAAISRLVESLARAANDATTPEAAMTACLGLICEHGRWAIGRVALYREGRPEGVPLRSIWHTADHARFAGLVAFSESHAPAPGGAFLSRVLREQVAVWIEDFRLRAGFTRKSLLEDIGLHSAFAFPIIVRGSVAAVMEVFGEGPRPQDPLVMGAAQSLASQLARILEREAAHQADARMAAIVESSQDAIISRALDGTILTWNAGAERLFGYTAAEIVGRNLAVLYPPERRRKMFRRQKLVLQGKAVPTIETERLTKDGRRVMVSLSSAPIRDSSGEVLGISTIMRDITGRKLAEQALRQAQQQLQLAVQGGNVGLWDWDVRAGTVYFSPEWKRQLGYDDHELPSRFDEWERRVHPEDLPRVNAVVAQFLERPRDYQQEYRMRHRDGSYRWILSRASSQVGDDGKVERMFGCHVDITAQKQVEAERLQHAVVQRDALVREVHHRIKNNLQGVMGLLRQRARKNPAITADIEETISQLQSVALVYGLQETRADGLLSLSEMVEAICNSVEGLVGGHVDRLFKRWSARPACVVGTEAVSVAVALNELLFNALKHQPAVAGRKRARVTYSEAADAAEIRITNRGRLPKRFDFATGRGLGNGLGLVRTLLDTPGGSLEFRDRRGRVEGTLKLAAPLLAGSKQRFTRRKHDGNAAGAETAAAAHPGRGRRPAGARRAG